MSKSKTQAVAPVQPIAFVQAPCVVFVANLRGGTGKTTTSLTFADLMALNGVEVAAFQVDEQPQLQTLLGRKVVSLLPQLGAASQPRALTSPFAPLYNACQRAAADGGVVLVDVGANMISLIARWLRDVELQEDLDAWGVRAVVLVPAVRETAAVEGAIETLATLRAALPGAVPVFIENQRDDGFDTVKSNSELGRLLRDQLPVALEGCAHLVMPGIEGDAWASFEAAGLRFIKALAMSPADVAERIQEDVADAKIMRSYLVRYLRTMHVEFQKVFLLPEGGA